MHLVKVSPTFYNNCKIHGTDSELLFNESGRPCVLLLKLMYKGQKRSFVVPLRSNIAPNVPKSQYFPLPPNKNTRPGCRHGIHYIKIFPISKEYIQKYNIDGNIFLQKVNSIINFNTKAIVTACQNYLAQAETGNRHPMTPDIDGILTWLDPPKKQ